MTRSRSKRPRRGDRMARSRLHCIKITFEDVKAFFDYSPDEGRLVWKARSSSLSRARIGAVAGTINGNYRTIRVNGVGLYEHRLVWMWHHGEWPHGEIDHINGDGFDNRIANLRLVDRFENAQNVKDLSTNKLGLRGVCYIPSRRKYRATIRANGKCTTLGHFETAEEARSAYLLARAILHPTHQPRAARGVSPCL